MFTGWKPSKNASNPGVGHLCRVTLHDHVLAGHESGGVPVGHTHAHVNLSRAPFHLPCTRLLFERSPLTGTTASPLSFMHHTRPGRAAFDVGYYDQLSGQDEHYTLTIGASTLSWSCCGRPMHGGGCPCRVQGLMSLLPPISLAILQTQPPGCRHPRTMI